MILVDTNVWVRVLRPDDLQHSDAVTAITSLRTAGHPLVLVPQVLYELWAVSTRPVANNGLGFSIEQAIEDQRRLMVDCELLEEDAGVYILWSELVARNRVVGKPTHDARLVAAMVRHGVTHLLTFNGQDFARFSEVAVITPAAAATFPAAGT